MCKTVSLFFPRGQNIFFMCETEQKWYFFSFLNIFFFPSLDVTHEKKDLKKKGLFRIIFHVWKQVNLFIFFQNNVTNKNSECLSAREKCFLLFVMCETEWKFLYFILFKVILFYFFCTNVFFHLLRHMNNSLWINLMYNFLLSKHIFK